MNLLHCILTFYYNLMDSSRRPNENRQPFIFVYTYCNDFNLDFKFYEISFWKHNQTKHTHY